MLGLCNMYPAPGIILGMAKDWDFVWIDGQHGEMSYDAIRHATLACAAIGVDSLIRVPGHETATLGLYADLAPSAVMVPLVDTAEQAQSIVRGLRFPPDGNRSYGGRRIIDLYGRGYYRERELMIVAQIETLQGATNAAAIIDTPGVDCLFFGPDDMKVQMGVPIATSALEHPRTREAMAHTARVARAAGKCAATVAPDRETFDQALAMGYQMIVGGGDVMFLRTLSAQRLADYRAATAHAQPAAPVAEGSY